VCYTRGVPRSLRFAVLGPFLATIACGSDGATISVTTGGESDTFTRDPAVTTLEIDAVDRTDASTPLADASYPAQSIDLGNPSQSLVASLQLTGKDSAGNAVVWGAAPFAELGAFNGTTVPLFVQRKGEFARMPGAIADARTSPLLAVTARAVYFAGGSISGATTPPPTGGYDLLALNGFSTIFAANRAARSFALIQLATETQDGDLALGLLIDDAGADLFGLATQELYSTDSFTKYFPSGMSWSDLAGGATVVSPDDGSVYILGPSKTDAPSRLTLKFPTSGNGSTISGAQRQGAAVAWAPKRGVFVYGGSATEVGAELIIDTASVAQSQIASDPTQGLAAIALDDNTMLLAGTKDVPHTIDLSCTKDCVPAQWGQNALPFALTSPSLFALGGGAFLIVGDDPNGNTTAFRLTATKQPEERKPKIARSGARAIQTQTGSIILVGGGSSTPESYVD
jgi:hypothetical protein